MLPFKIVYKKFNCNFKKVVDVNQIAQLLQILIKKGACVCSSINKRSRPSVLQIFTHLFR